MSKKALFMMAMRAMRASGSDESSDEGISDEEYAKRTRFLAILKTWLNENTEKKSSYERRLFYLNYYLTAPHIYLLCKNTLNFHVFPSLTELKEFKANFEPGICEDLTTLLAKRLKNLPAEAKYVTLCVDNMKVTPNMYYDTNTDKIIGFVDIDGVRSNGVVTNAFLVLLNGCLFPYVQPLGYAYTNEDGQYSLLGQWIDKMIRNLHNAGFVVCGLVSRCEDLAKTKEITTEKPYFEVDGSKVYFIFDPQSLMISIRNVLIATNLFYGEDKLVSWSDVVDVQMQHKILTEAHVNPTPKQRLEWDLVSGVFDESVGILIAVKYQPEDCGTSSFFITMDALCDIITERKGIGAIGDKYFVADSDDIECFEDALALFKSIKLPENATTDEEIDINCFANIQITINAIKQMHNHFAATGLPHLVMKRISSKPLMRFQQVIGKECKTTKPTPIKFQRAYSKLMLNYLIDNSSKYTMKEDFEQIIQSGSFITLFKDNIPDSN